MTPPVFTKAVKQQAKARIAIDGPAGSGKTYTALVAATALAQGGKIAVVDTERKSASLYADEFDFDTTALETFNPQNYVDAIHAAESAGYAVIVLDSISHAWEGEGGALDMVDAAAAKSQSKNSYFAWRDVTPVHRKLVDAMLQSPCHIVATMRSKTEYIIETDAKGRQVPKKVGMAPIQRAGVEYEFTVVGDMDIDHRIVISKSRCKPLADKSEVKPGPAFWQIFVDWLNSGAPYVAPPPPPPATPPVKQQAAPAPVKLASRAALLARLGQLHQEAIGLGMAVEPIAENAADQQIVAAGQALAARIAEVRAAQARPINPDPARPTPPAPAASPAGGNGKALPSHQALLARWSELWNQAKALGLNPAPLDGAKDKDLNYLVERGQGLGSWVRERAWEIYSQAVESGVIGGDQQYTDEQIIRIAVDLSKQQAAIAARGA